MLGVVAIDLRLDILGSALRLVRDRLLASLPGPLPAGLEAGVHFLLLDPAGRLFATSDNDPVVLQDQADRGPTQARWTDSVSDLVVRRSLAAITAFWGGSLAAAFADRSEPFRVYPDPDFFVCSATFADDFNARILSVAVFPIALHRWQAASPPLFPPLLSPT